MARFARPIVCSLAILVFASCAATRCAEAGEGQRIDYQKIADGARWGWSAEEATPFYCTSQAGSTFDIHLINDHGKRHVWTIRILKENRKVYEWAGHRLSVFRILDDRLYYARYHPSSTGGVIVAVDLGTGRELWESRLQALGGISHSAYFNSMTLDANHDVVSVYGNEAMGRYFEIKDARTGKTVAHRLFKGR